MHAGCSIGYSIKKDGYIKRENSKDSFSCYNGIVQKMKEINSSHWVSFHNRARERVTAQPGSNNIKDFQISIDIWYTI